MWNKLYNQILRREKRARDAGIILGVLIIALICMSYFFMVQFNTMIAYNKAIDHSYQVINQLQNAESYLKDAETGVRGYTITKDTAFLQPLNTAKIKLQPALDSLKDLFAGNVNELKDYNKLQRNAHLKMSLIEGSIAFTELHEIPVDSLYLSMKYEKDVMDNYRAYSQTLKQDELKILNEKQSHMLYYQAKLPGNFKFLFVITAFITLLIVGWLFIELRNRIKFQNQLEQKVIELNLNNSDLQQIAFAASHDLQEPLRKIRIFSDRLQTVAKNKLEGESLMLTQRINIFAARLQALIEDIVKFNELFQNRQIKEIIDLNNVVAAAKNNFTSITNEKNIFVEYKNLPEIFASREEVEIIFTQLFANSRQFSSKDKELIIQINSSVVKGKNIENFLSAMKEKNYYDIQFSDNGIGFDNFFKAKMFQPFQRLHNFFDEQKGRRKGMGLAICKRVMINNGGWIDADGKENEGAVFHLYFPVI